MYMNRYDVDTACLLADREDAPVLQVAAGILSRLVDWTDNNSDGWPYWSKPSNASRGLQVLITEQVSLLRQGHLSSDVAQSDLTKALAPVKAFLTRQARENRVTPAEVGHILGMFPR